MAERTPWKPVSTCRSWSKRAASLKSGLKQAINKVENLLGRGSPEPTSSPRTPTPPLNPFPEPASPPGRIARIPGVQHDHEASGSNHTSNHTSEYFDAVDPSEYLQQHQIRDYTEMNNARNRRQYGSEQGYEYAQQGIEHLQQGFERPYPGLEEQLAGSFGNILLNTPTASNASHPHPWDDLLNTVHDQQVQDYYYSGELKQDWLQPDDATESLATSTAQHQQQMTMLPGYVGMSVRTGETEDSRESLMDTAGTSTTPAYILPPVDEEKPSILPRPFNKLYVELRRIARGDEVAFASARMGRGMRVLGKAFCYTLRLRKTVMKAKLAKAQRKRIWEPLQKQKSCQQCMKKMRKGSPPKQPMTPGVSTQSTTKSRYKSIKNRNGHWNAEIRVSLCTVKVWIGTFSTEREAALAMDAGHYHCSEKYKKFNFPDLVHQLGPSQYQTVLALCKAEKKDEVTKLVKKLAADHAAAFKEP